MNLGRYVSRSARYWPNNTALIFGRLRSSYRDFDQRTNRLAQGLLALGLKTGDSIAIQSWNRHEVVEFEIACYKAGLVRVPINARLAVQETLHILNDSEARAVILGPRHVEAVLDHRKEIPSVHHIIGIGNPQTEVVDYEGMLIQSPDVNPDIEVDYDDIAVLHYTSGTTGRLKAAMQTFGNRLALLRKGTMTIDTRVEPGDIFGSY